MAWDTNSSNQLARARELRRTGESARRRDGATAQKCYEESVTILRQLDEPLLLAHTVRHLGDVYHEQGRSDLAENCYLEALNLCRKHQDRSPLDLANAIRSLAVLRWEQSRALWEEARDFYTAIGIETGIKESTARIAAIHDFQ
jgi:tetratricopeptide (TPR) repeat protein